MDDAVGGLLAAVGDLAEEEVVGATAGDVDFLVEVALALGAVGAAVAAVAALLVVTVTLKTPILGPALGGGAIGRS